MKIDNRLTYLIVGVLAVLVLVGGWFLGVSPQLADAAQVDGQLAQAQQKNQMTQTQLAELKVAKGKLPALQDQLAKLQLAVPDSVQGSALLAAVSKLAADNGASVTGFGLGAPTSYSPQIAAAPSTAAGAPAAAATPPAAAGSAAAAPAGAQAATAAITPYSDTSITSANFAVMSFTTTVTAGDPAPLLAFVQALQTGDRLVLLTSAQLSAQPGMGGVSYQMMVSGNVYMTRSAASAPAASGAKASAAPTPSPTASPSGSTSPTPVSSPTTSRVP